MDGPGSYLRAGTRVVDVAGFLSLFCDRAEVCSTDMWFFSRSIKSSRSRRHIGAHVLADRGDPSVSAQRAKSMRAQPCIAGRDEFRD